MFLSLEESNVYLKLSQKKFSCSLSVRLKIVRDFFYHSNNFPTFKVLPFVSSEEKLRIALKLKALFISYYNFIYTSKVSGNSFIINSLFYYLDMFCYLWSVIFSSFLEKNQDKFSFFSKSFHNYSEYNVNNEILFPKKLNRSLTLVFQKFNIFDSIWSLNNFPSFKLLIGEFIRIFQYEESFLNSDFYGSGINSLYSNFFSFTLKGLL